MRDLSATMFYKAKFNITAKNQDECDLLWKLVMNIRSWITKKLNRNGLTVVETEMNCWTAFMIRKTTINSLQNQPTMSMRRIHRTFRGLV